jgi:hypothetical protein
VLEFTHVLIKLFAAKNKDEVPLDKQIARSNLGPIADAHLSVLHELLDIDPANEELYEWLGIRYAERCEWEDSEHFYRALRVMRAPKLDRATQLLLWKVPADKQVGGRKSACSDS